MKQGILRQSVVAIGALTLSTVLAAGIGIYAFLDVGERAPRYLEANASGLAEALKLTESAGELLAKAPKIYIIKNEIELDSFRRAINEMIKQLDASLTSLERIVPKKSIENFKIVQHAREPLIESIEDLLNIKASMLQLKVSIDIDLKEFWKTHDLVNCLWVSLSQPDQQSVCSQNNPTLPSSPRTIKWLSEANSLIVKVGKFLITPRDGIPSLDQIAINQQLKDLVVSANRFPAYEKKTTTVLLTHIFSFLTAPHNLIENVLSYSASEMHMERLISDRRIVSFLFTSSISTLVEDIQSEAYQKNKSLIAHLDILLFMLLIILSISIGVGVFGFFYFKDQVIERLISLQSAVRGAVNGVKDENFNSYGDDEIGKLGQAYAYFMDEIEKREDKIVKDRDKANELAVIANEGTQAKSRFLAAMSHDLRTPLNAILGYSDMIRMKIFGPIGDPHYGEYADDIHHSGTHLLNLINDVLDLSKIEAGKYDLTEAPQNISELVQSSFRQLINMSKSVDQTLTAEIPENIPLLLCDETAMTQILNNLISNAIKFTPDGGEISVTAHVDKASNGIVLRVIDTGIGMSKEELSQALKPFEQIDGTHSRKHKGTGLGLCLCNDLMKLQGGTMALESNIGQGTTAILCFSPKNTIAQ